MINLRLNNNDFDLSAANKIANTKSLPHLKSLELNGSLSEWTDRPSLKDAGARAIMESSSLTRLAFLSLKRQQLTDDVTRTVVETAAGKRWAYLDLSRNQIGDAGAKTLCQAGPWDRLAVLNLRQNNISKAMNRALKERFGYRVII